MRVEVRGEPLHAGSNPRRFGHRRGITQITARSPTRRPASAASPCRARLAQQPGWRSAHSDVVFGLFWPLGTRFGPRLADIGGARSWRIDRVADCGAEGASLRVDTKRIGEAWPDLLRLAGSPKLGRVRGLWRDAPGSQARERPTALARALIELGRLVKAPHVLDTLDDAGKRRRILVQLTRQKLRHRPARRVCHGNRGEIAAGCREGQEETLGALGPVLNVVAPWNATTIRAAIAPLEAEDHRPDLADLARASPPPHRHIAVLGDPSLTLPKAVADGELRPLRKPAS